MTACLRFTKQVWASFVKNAGHDAQCFPNLEIRRATPGLVECSLLIEKYNLNRNQTVHGGLLLSLVDTVGSLAVATKGHFMTGVSTDLSATFVRPGGTTGNLVHAKGTIVGLGKTLAFTRIDFTDESGKVVAYGSHTKFIASTLNHERNVKFSPDREHIVEGKEE